MSSSLTCPSVPPPLSSLSLAFLKAIYRGETFDLYESCSSGNVWESHHESPEGKDVHECGNMVVGVHVHVHSYVPGRHAHSYVWSPV